MYVSLLDDIFIIMVPKYTGKILLKVESQKETLCILPSNKIVNNLPEPIPISFFFFFEHGHRGFVNIVFWEEKIIHYPGDIHFFLKMEKVN